MGAPFQVNIALTDDETFEFVCEWKMEDGSDFPWADYSYEYEVRGQYQEFTLTLGTGIDITEELNCIGFSWSGDPLIPGFYRHGCRITHTASGRVFQIFDGTVTITEGNF